MPVALSGNMRARSTARLKSARLANFRLGGVMKDVSKVLSTNHYVWTMERGVKPIDSSLGMADSAWVPTA